MPETVQSVQTAAPGVAAAQPPTVQPPAATPPAAQQTADHFGQAITAGDTVRLASLVQAPSQYAGQTIRTEGTVSAVCQAMGCWMEIRDESAQVHIRMHGHSFFIPRTARGRHASVQATVIPVNPRGECEREAAQQTGQQVAALELDATGVDLR